MNVCSKWSSAVMVGILVLSLTIDLNAETPRNPKAFELVTSDEKEKSESTTEPVSVEEARNQAKLMHNIYAKTLLVMHQHYFRREGAVLPARALEDVFAGIDDQSKIKARWIAVNTPPMSINHKAEGDFELKAVAQLSEGKNEFERVEDGYYKRVGMIPLGIGCVGCHTKVFQAPAKGPRFAGLVIAIPVKAQK